MAHRAGEKLSMGLLFVDWAEVKIIGIDLVCMAYKW